MRSSTKGALIGALLASAALPAHAAPVIYNFTGPTAGTNVDLGQTEIYSASGAPNLTAAAGIFGGSAPPGTNDSFTMSSGVHLVGNNRGADEQGVGVCGAGSWNCWGSDLTGEHGEIDRDSEEAVRLDIGPLYASYGAFVINADSATEGEILGVFQSSSTGNIGSPLTNLTSADGNFTFSPTMNYLYFVSNGANGAGGENVLLHSLTVTPMVEINPTGSAVPEPASLAMLGTGLVGMGTLALQRRRRRE